VLATNERKAVGGGVRLSVHLFPFCMLNWPTFDLEFLFVYLSRRWLTWDWSKAYVGRPRGCGEPSIGWVHEGCKYDWTVRVWQRVICCYHCVVFIVHSTWRHSAYLLSCRLLLSWILWHWLSLSLNSTEAVFLVASLWLVRMSLTSHEEVRHVGRGSSRGCYAENGPVEFKLSKYIYKYKVFCVLQVHILQWKRHTHTCTRTPLRQVDRAHITRCITRRCLDLECGQYRCLRCRTDV